MKKKKNECNVETPSSRGIKTGKTRSTDGSGSLDII